MKKSDFDGLMELRTERLYPPRKAERRAHSHSARHRCGRHPCESGIEPSRVRP